MIDPTTRCEATLKFRREKRFKEDWNYAEEKAVALVERAEVAAAVSDEKSLLRSVCEWERSVWMHWPHSRLNFINSKKRLSGKWSKDVHVPILERDITVILLDANLGVHFLMGPFWIVGEWKGVPDSAAVPLVEWIGQKGEWGHGPVQSPAPEIARPSSLSVLSVDFLPE